MEVLECASCSGKAKMGEPVNKNLVSDNQLLTNELILAQRDLQKLKQDHKTAQDQLKKSERENAE